MTRILIVANQTLGCPELEEALEPYLEVGSIEFILVAPIAAMEEERQWDYPAIDRYIPSPEQIAHALAAGTSGARTRPAHEARRDARRERSSTTTRSPASRQLLARVAVRRRDRLHAADQAVALAPGRPAGPTRPGHHRPGAPHPRHRRTLAVGTRPADPSDPAPGLATQAASTTVTGTSWPAGPRPAGVSPRHRRVFPSPGPRTAGPGREQLAGAACRRPSSADAPWAALPPAAGVRGACLVVQSILV